jgi:hypothetical protein
MPATRNAIVGRDAELAVHYDLHVWVYEANASGTFAQFNPEVSC